MAERKVTARFAAALLVVAVAAAAPSIASAQSPNTEHTLKLDEAAVRPAAEIESLAWLAGYWRGEGSIGVGEEIWAPPSSGTMVGAFKAVRDGEPSFYELLEISEEEGSLILKIKHFDPELKGWEERDGFVAFPLVKLAPQEAYFSGLTYRRVDDRLYAYVATTGKDGRVGELEFVFDRYEPEPAEGAASPAD